ncbi:MAG: phosphoribosylformylglycinamidine synthase subunit PurL [Thermoproteota archaeon]|nr:phosphoribosylformylglycinamidine synthase subunit PurL [Thermoproteota archaeon]
MKILKFSEYQYLKKRLGRIPNELEQSIISAEWSEHCSYKSSKKHLRTLPTKGKSVIIGPGFDAGVLDVGNGYVITVHIESHNHPSAVEPHGGAATGVGGVIRDIMSMGTRPIAIFNALRFGNIDGEEIDTTFKNRWLFSNVVKGIADYGNCIGIPTVGGEIEFDNSFDNYCLVDVASIGHGKIDKIIKNHAKEGDLIILAGNSTGKDGIHGASFASKKLEEDNRSAVQIPDPLLEKNLLEATIEAIDNKCIKAIKDLGGGGLACCLSETADSLQKGFEIELTRISLKQNDMTDSEIIISESQERMLYVTSKLKSKILFRIFDKYGISFSVIGEVNNTQNLSIKKNGKTVAKMPAKLIAHAPLLDRPSLKPQYIQDIYIKFKEPPIPKDIKKKIYSMLSNPSICKKEWVYQQFDYDVGLRTVLKPGDSDASVLSLDNGKFLTFKLDGNSKHCYIDPYQGTLGCLAESLRNTICVGAKPIGIVDHLQFGNPEEKTIFWTFLESIRAIKDFCNFMEIPVVGGKVSLYNETSGGSIKPSPIIGMLGIIENNNLMVSSKLEEEDHIFIVGMTREELGGSEYFEYCYKVTGGEIPKVDLEQQKKIIGVIWKLVQKNLIKKIHDCSKGGLLIALFEMAIQSDVGITLDIGKVPNDCKRTDYVLFSESHNRFIIFTKNSVETSKILSESNIPYGDIGKVTAKKFCLVKSNKKSIFTSKLSDISKVYNESLSRIMENG